MLKFPWSQKIWMIILGSLSGVLTIVTISVIVVTSSSANEGIDLSQSKLEEALAIPVEIEDDLDLLNEITVDNETYVIEYESSELDYLDKKGTLLSQPSYAQGPKSVVLIVTARVKNNTGNFATFFLNKTILPELEIVTITYQDESGNEIETVNVLQGNVSLDVLENRTNQRFVGWKIPSSDTVFTELEITSDTILQSVYHPFFEVVFLTPLDPFSVSVEPGDTLDLDTVSAPSIEGYSFVGFEDRSNNPIQTLNVSSNMIVRAVYTPIYTIDIYGLDDLKERITLEEGDVLEISDLPDMEEEGYTFLGFYDLPTSGSAINEDMTVKENMRIYGRYQPVVRLSILGNDVLQATENITYGALVDLSSLNLPPVSGYTFVRFENLDGNPITEITLERDTTIKAVYQDNEDEFQVTLLDRYGEVIRTDFVASNESYTLPELNDKENYAFKGFGRIINTTQILGSSLTITEDTTLYSQWNPLYDVTIVSTLGDTTIQKVESGTLFRASSYTPETISDYTFTGLFNGTRAISSITVNDNITLTARYNPIYTVSIFAFDTLQQTRKVASGSTLSASNVTHQAIDGYTFRGFKDASGNTISQEVITSNVTWIADYEKQSFTVSFDIDSSYQNDLENVPSSFFYEEPLFLPMLDNEDVQIEGFYLDASFETPYLNNASTNKENLTIYIKLRQSRYQLSLDTNPFVSNALDELTVSVGEVLSITPPSLEGYLFAGWMENATMYAQTFVMPDKDVSLTAQFISESAIINALNLPQNFESNSSFPSQITVDNHTLNVSYLSSDITYVDNEGQVLSRPLETEGNVFLNFTVTVSLFDGSFSFTHDATLTPVSDEVTITYVHLNGDLETRTLQKNDRLVLNDGLAYTDYALEGWYLNPALTNVATTETMVEDDITIYAKYNSLIDVTVVFGDSSSQVIKVLEGERLFIDTIEFEVPEGIEIVGYINFTNGTVVEESFVVTQSTILLQEFDLIEKEITLEVDPNIFPSAPPTIDFVLDDYIDIPNIDTETHRVLGWYFDAELTQPYDLELVEFEDFSLYPKYEKFASKITFDRGIANYNGETEILILSGDMVSLNSNTQPSLEGFTFEGWESTSDGELVDFTSYIADGNDLSVVARMTPNNYLIKHVSNGGSSISDKQVTFDTTIGELQVPSRTGFNFLGWFLDESLTIPFNPTEIMGSEDVTVYAKYEPILYTLSVIDESNILISDTYLYDEIITLELPQDLTKSGSEFLGFDGTIPLTMPNNNITISAIFSPRLEVDLYSSYLDVNALTAFEFDYDFDFVTYTSISLYGGSLQADGINQYGVFGVTDTSIEIDIGQDESYDIGQNLNLNPGELVTNLNVYEYMVYAYTSEYRLMRWGQLTTDSAIITPEVIDTLESPLKEFLAGDIGVVVVTEDNEMYGYNTDNSKTDLTRHYLQMGDDFKFASKIPNPTVFKLDGSSFPIGYNPNSFVFYELDSDNLIFPFVVSKDVIQLEGVETNPGSVIEFFTYNLDYIIVFDNLIFQSNEGGPFAFIEVELIIDLNPGEAIEEVILNPFNNVDLPLSFPGYYLDYLPSFFTSEGRLLIPEILGDGETLNFFDATEELIIHEDNIESINGGVIILKENIVVDPMILYRLYFDEYLENIAPDFTSLENTLPTYSELDGQEKALVFESGRIQIENIKGPINVAQNVFGEVVLYSNSDVYFLEKSNINEFNPYSFINTIGIQDADLFFGIGIYGRRFESAQTILETVPVHPSYVTFAGWYLDEEKTTPATISNLESGMSIYAKFDQLQHRIYYYLLGVDNREFFYDIGRTYEIDISPGEIPPVPSVDMFNLGEDIKIYNDYYHEESLSNFSENTTPYAFDVPLDHMQIIFSRIAPSKVTITVINSDESIEYLSLDNQEYLYRSLYIEDPEFSFGPQNFTGFYEDEALETRYPEDTIIDGPMTVYLGFDDNYKTVLLEEEVLISNVAFSTPLNWSFNIVQMQNNDIYLNPIFKGVLEDASPFNIDPEIYQSLKGYYVNITDLFSLDSNETLVDFKFNYNVPHYYHPFFTSSNRVFMTGYNPYTNEGFDARDVILDYQDKTVKDVLFTESSSSELWVLLEDGTIEIYTYTEPFSEAFTVTLERTIELIEGDFTSLHFIEHEHHILLVTDQEFFFIDPYTKDITHHQTLTDDNFIDVLQRTEIIDISSINNYRWDYEINIISENGRIFSYDASLKNPYIKEEDIFLLEGETVISAGLFELGPNALSKYSTQIGLVTSEYYLTLVGSDVDLKIDYDDSRGDIVHIDYSIVFENGMIINTGIAQTGPNTYGLELEYTQLDLNDQNIVRLTEEYDLIYELSDGSYISVVFIAEPFNLKGFKALSDIETPIIYDVNDVLDERGELVKDGFLGWTNEFDYINPSQSELLDDYPTESGVWVAIYE